MKQLKRDLLVVAQLMELGQPLSDDSKQFIQETTTKAAVYIIEQEKVVYAQKE